MLHRREPIVTPRAKPLGVIAAVLGLAVAAAILGLTSFPAGAADDGQPSGLEAGVDQILFQEIQTVVGASKYEQKTTEAPSYISIVTADEIKRFGYRTLAEIVGSVAGFYANYDRSYNYVGIRGFSLPGDYNTRVLVMLNGHRLNENIYDSTGFGTEGIIDVDLIERVEVIRGPGSSLYGSNAFLGVINIVTKRGRNYKGPQVSGGAGSYETYQGRGTYGDRYGNGLDLLLSGTYTSSQGKDRLFYSEFDSPDTNYGHAERADGQQSHSLFTSLLYGDVTLEGAYVKRRKQIPTAPYGTVFNDNRTQVWEERGYLDAKYERQVTSDFGAMLRLSYDGYWYDGDYMYDNPPLTKQKDSAAGQWLGSELQLTKRLFDNHKVIAGGEVRYNYQQDQETHDEEPYSQYLNEKTDSSVWALFIQDEYRVLDNLTLFAGLRYDDYSTFGGSLNPRAALIYNPFSQTTLKLIYGRAFRAPNVYELYYNDGGQSAKANPDLDPETIDAYQVVVEQYFAKYFRAAVSGYYYKIQDLISQVEDPDDGLVVFRNTSEAEARGVEFEIEMNIPRSGWKARAAWSIQDAEDEETGDDLVNSPMHLLKLNLIAPLFEDKIFAGPELQYIGKRKTVQGGAADDAYVTNLTVSTARGLFPVLPGLELSASCYNLFDEKYGTVASADYRQSVIDQDGRTFFLKATYSF
jgi:iron complex outermembrane receptor protein